MNNFGISSGSTKDDGDDEQTRLPGFRFHPTDQELVGFYLRRKVEKKPMIMELIRQIDIYKYDPWDLPKGSTVGENEWYFFCKRGRKYKNSVRPNRVTKSGFWKATGIDKPLYSSSTHNHSHINGSPCIGLKKSLVYYIGAAGKGSKTDWMMHEFRLPPIDHPEQSTNMQISNSKLLSPHLLPEAEVWTLCRIFKRNMSYKKYNNNNGTIYGYNPPVSKKQVPTYKQIPREACSATCSIESDDRSNYNGYISFETPLNTFQNNHHHQKKEMDDGRSQQLLLSQFNPNMSITSTASLGLSEAGSGLSINQGFFTNEDWDELRSVVDQSLLPNSPFQ